MKRWERRGVHGLAIAQCNPTVGSEAPGPCCGMPGSPPSSGDPAARTASDFCGKYISVYFGYTCCPDVFPTSLNAIAAAPNRLGPKAKDLTPIFVTVDPQRDTPQVMPRYTVVFGPGLIGLTGTPDEMQR